MCAGAAVVSGYFNNPAASAAAIDGEGWFATGDVATISHDGWLILVDRAKDLVKSGGEWISSIDVENEALRCPGVASAAVIAVPHPKWHERPLLVVVKAPGADPRKEDMLGAPGDEAREMAGAGRCRLRRRLADDGDGQSLETRIARQVRGFQAAGVKGVLKEGPTS